LTYWLGKPRVKVSHFAMVNLIAGKAVVPELVQGDFTPRNVVAHLRTILADGSARDRMLDDLGQIKGKLRAPEAAPGLAQHAAGRAAEIIVSILSNPTLSSPPLSSRSHISRSGESGT